MTLTHAIEAVVDAKPDNDRLMEFLVGGLGAVDADLLADGYDQLQLGQAHASRALDLWRLCNPDTARHLMLMNAKLFLDQAKAL